MFEGPRVADDLSNGASLQIVPKSEDRIRESNEQESGREERKEEASTGEVDESVLCAIKRGDLNEL